MDQFPGNSQRQRTTPQVPQEPKKIERVTSADTTRRPKGLGRKFRETFIGGDARSAFSYMIVDVVVPAIQDTLVDAFQGGIERLIKGENSSRPRRSGRIGGYSEVGHFDYRGISTGPARSKPSQPRMLSRKSRARGAFDELVIPSRGEAEEVIDRMFDILARYGVVSVADLYELTGVQSSHTDMKYGWYELRGSKAQRLRQGGFLLDLPEPEAIN